METLVCGQFAELQTDELYTLDGGKLETLSDWLLLGGGICAAFVAPQIGVPIVIAVALWS